MFVRSVKVSMKPIKELQAEEVRLKLMCRALCQRCNKEFPERKLSPVATGSEPRFLLVCINCEEDMMIWGGLMNIDADIVRRKLLNLELCPRCKKEEKSEHISEPFLPGCFTPVCPSCRDDLRNGYFEHCHKYHNSYTRPTFLERNVPVLEVIDL